MIVEVCPALKTDKQFARLLATIVEMEYQLLSAKHVYNATAARFNELVLKSPSSIVARASHYHPLPVIIIREDEQAPVDLNALLKTT
jgi:hypothetical protein